jgi:hypothetical protein
MGPGKHGKALGLDKGAKTLSLSVVNGSGKNKVKVSSAKIFINGKQIFTPSDFSAGKAIKNVLKQIEVGPDLDKVDVDVEVKGKKGSEITLTITGIYEDVEPPLVIVIFFMDGDMDGIGGDVSMPGDINNPPDGPWVLVGGDCNDADPTAMFPGDPGCLF